MRAYMHSSHRDKQFQQDGNGTRLSDLFSTDLDVTVTGDTLILSKLSQSWGLQ